MLLTSRPAAAATDPEVAALRAQVEALNARVEMLTRLIQQPPPNTAAGPQTRAAEASPAPTAAAKDVPPLDGAPTVVALASPQTAVPPGAAVALQPSTPTTADSVPPGGSIGFAAGRPQLRSADGRFVANLRGLLDLDAADYLQRAAGAAATDLRRGGGIGEGGHARNLDSSLLLRRARIGFDGIAFGDFAYALRFEAGGAGVENPAGVQEAWLQYSGLRPFFLRVGAFAPSLGLEDAGSTVSAPFLERASSAEIARNVAGGSQRLGVQVIADGRRWFASGAFTSRRAAPLNGAGPFTSQDYEGQAAWTGRLAYLPVERPGFLLHLGAHGSFVERLSDATGPDGPRVRTVQLRDRPELRVDGTRLVDTGALAAEHVWTAGLEFGALMRNVSVVAEYERIGVVRSDGHGGDPQFDGFYTQAAWTLTGGRRRYNAGNFAFDGPSLTKPFNPRAGAWGTIELAGRYSQVDLNFQPGSGSAPLPNGGVRGGVQRIQSVALNWYLNEVVRETAEFQHVEVDRLSPNAAAYVTPLGAQIGQSYDAISLRSQLAF